MNVDQPIAEQIARIAADTDARAKLNSGLAAIARQHLAIELRNLAREIGAHNIDWIGAQ